jgi:hypothetical protein
MRFCQAFSRPFQLSSVNGATIGQATSTPLSKDERQDAFEAISSIGNAKKAGEHFLDETLHQTVFTDIVDGKIEVLHGIEVRFLCMSREGEVFSFPDLPEKHSV